MSFGPRDRVSRRSLVLGAGAAVLLGGCSGGGEEPPGPAGDLRLLRRALAVEQALIAAYEAMPAAQARLVLDVAEQEREHAEAMARAIRDLGGRPGPGREPGRRPGATGEAAPLLRSALRLEEQALRVYADAVVGLSDGELRATAAAILASEAGHAAVLRTALGEEPVPAAFAAAAGRVP